MPSSKNYVRNYKQEAATESPARKEDRRKREVARRAYIKASGAIPAGVDLNHIDPLSKGGSNKPSNWDLEKAHANRSYPRTKTGAMKGRRG